MFKVLSTSTALTTTASDVNKATSASLYIDSAGFIELYESDGTTIVGSIKLPVGVHILIKDPAQKFKSADVNGATGQITKIAHLFV